MDDGTDAKLLHYIMHGLDRLPVNLSDRVRILYQVQSPEPFIDASSADTLG